jgi:hypothetical protein
MADTTADQVTRYVLDGSDEDLRRLLSLSESSPFLLDLVLRKPNRRS